MKLKSLSNKDRYGNMFSVEFFEPDTSVPIIMAIPEPTYDHPGDPKGTDTVPAWLTPGEFVMNAEATRKYEPELKKMNNEGREMQEKQGGSIPTYADDGGIIQSVTDFFTMPKPPEGSGIKYRRHKDGSIGMWAGNTFRGYYKKPAKKESSFSERLGINYNAEGGGVPPMYASVGDYVMPDFLSDSFLDKNVIPGMYATETSSGANVKTSKKGAIGPMQILPTTAANPGFGVMPRTVAEISSLDGAQQFAKDYMRGIHRENPDFNLEEVVTAYHSGAKNVRKAKEGVEPLGPRGEAYADKVGVANTEESIVDKALNIASQLNPLGVTEASAQSTLVPADNAPPKNEDDDSLFSGVMDYLKNPPGVAKRRAENAEFNRKVAKNNAENVGESFEELEARRLRNIERGEDPFKGSEPVNEKTYNGLKKAVEFQKGEVIANTETSLVTNKVDPPIAAAVLEAEKKKLETLGQPNIGDATDADAMDITTASVNAAKKVVDNTDKSKIPPSNQDKIIKETGENADPTFIEKAKQSFIDAFGDLFNPRELARMAIIYTGSRLLGYSHDGSLGYAAKQYIARVDKFAADQFDAVKANRDSYTTESYNKYLSSRNMDDLVPVGGATGVLSEEGEMYLSGVVIGQDEQGQDILFNGVLPKVKLKDKTEAFIFPDGSRVRLDNPLVRGKYSKVRPELQVRDKVSERYMTAIDRAVKAAQRDKGIAVDDRFTATQTVADAATQIIFKEYELYGADPTRQTALARMMNKAIDKWAAASAEFVKTGKGLGPNKDRDPRDGAALEAFFLEEKIVKDFGISPKLIQGTDPYILKDLADKVFIYSDVDENDAKRDFRESQEIFNRGINKKGRKYGFDKEPPEGHTKLTWWMSRIYDSASPDHNSAITFLNENVK